MKKYLINGAWALFAGAFVVSCAEKESDFVPLAEQKVKAYDEVFKQLYGEIDPYQDWGFGSGKVEIDPNDSSVIVNVVDLDANVAFTRAAAFGRYNSLLAFNVGNTRTDNPNANEWAQTYNVPDPLKPGQKARVQFYFQTVKNPGGTHNYGQINFFVQQVYDGCTDPITKYEGYTSPAYSKEEYPAANNQTMIQSGEHMDHLTAGSDNEHIYNFNNGTCSTNDHVLDNGGDVNNGPWHSDEIMLMLNTKTDCFGYANSDASFVRKDRYRLVAGSVIDEYISTHYNEYEKWLNQHAGISDAIVDDMWHRSFIGFDFDMLPDDKLYVKDNGNYSYFSMNLHGKDKVWNGTSLVDASTVGEVSKDQYGNTVFYPFIPNTTTKIRMMTDQTNQYCGSTTTITDTDLEYEVNNVGKYANLKKVYELIANKALPTSSGAGKTWVNVGNCNDDYFSDWIVSFLPAGGAPQPDWDLEIFDEDTWTQIDRGRVFCEDLGQSTREDLDFNDVVFDAIVFSNYTYHREEEVKYINGKEVDRRIVSGPTSATKYYANVTILAAGGTIPIEIQSNKNTVPSFQVHSQFNPVAPVDMMVNTCDNNSTVHGSYDVREAVQIGNIEKHFDAQIEENGTTTTQHFDVKLFEIDPPTESNNYIKEIKIWSSFGTGTQVSELEHVKGGAPQKFMVPLDTKWTSERKNISLAYPGFDAWVGDRNQVPDWEHPVNGYYYNGSTASSQLPLVMKARRTVVANGESGLWTGTLGFDPTWNLYDVDLDLNNKNYEQFYPGDRLRIYAENIPIPENGQEFVDDSQKAWITVLIDNIQPYFIDTEFPNYVIEGGQKVYNSSGCIEVILDEWSANKLNTKLNNKVLSIQVQGRNFTLKRISKVEF